MKYTSSMIMLALMAIAIAIATGAVDATADTKTSKVPQLIAALADANVRYGASIALTKIGKAAVPGLIKSLASPQPDVRVWSAYTLGQIGRPAAAAADRLARSCRHKDDALRAASAEALGKLKTTSPAAIKALKKSLTDKQVPVRQRAVVALGRIGPAAGDAAAELVHALADGQVREFARDALIQIGPQAADLLLASLHEDRIRFDIRAILLRIDEEKARQVGLHQLTSADLPSLRSVLFDPTRGTEDRRAATAGLAALKGPGMRVLVEAFQDEKLAPMAAAGFAKTGPFAVPVLVEALGHNHPTVRATAADALAYLGPAAAKAGSKLIQLLEDADRDVRYRAVRALHSLGQKAGAAVPSLVKVINNSKESEATRQWAIKTLIVTLPETHDAVVRGLIEASNEKKNYGVRQLAKQQLLKIDPEAAKRAGMK